MSRVQTRRPPATAGAPSDANERGSAAQAEAVLPATEQQADRGQSQNSVPAERNDQQAPEAHGPGASDTASSHGKPETPGETRSDAAPTPKAHALLDPDPALHGSKTLSATELPGGAHDPTDGRLPGLQPRPIGRPRRRMDLVRI